jgi:hypothetical protein
VLFELWDECYEPAVAGEEPTGESVAGRAARRRIESFVRRYFPEGSDRGYAAAELTRLNARRQSRDRFAPYGP